MTTKRTLYSYYRSSAAYRVRIALALKGLSYDTIPVHLLRDGGEQLMPAYRRRNPEGLVPTFEDEGHVLTQSLAIIEYLDEAYDAPKLLPATPLARARVRALALHIACDIHPLNNLRVLRYLTHPLEVDKAQRDQWYRHWVTLGFEAIEARLKSGETGRFCHGDTPTLADCCLVPQVYNARRLEVDMTDFPTIERIDLVCSQLPAFQASAPEACLDAPTVASL
ncbi:MAG: maleylacetoacetate isomerase [Alcaligenaceae bacterium]|nr:maleylacetoacetate isomerase [Alcaligenaceae bacterium]